MVLDLDLQSEVYNNRADEIELSADNDLTNKIITDLRDSIGDRVYLCANEIGYNARVICVKFGDDKIIFVNPALMDLGDKSLARETYLGKDYLTPRSKELTLCYQDEFGKPQANKFTDDAAVIFQEAIECLDGIHFDYSLEVIPGFDEAPDEAKEEVIKDYLNQLDELYAKLDADLSNEETTKKAWSNYKFNRAVALGEVELEEEQPMNRKQRRLIDRLLRKNRKGK